MTSINIPDSAVKRLRKKDLVDLFILLTKAITDEKVLPNRVKIYGVKYTTKKKVKVEFKVIFGFGQTEAKEKRVYKTCVINFKQEKIYIKTTKKIKK